MDFRITGLSAEPFRHLYGMPDEELRALGVRRRHADGTTGMPDRIEMRDARAGETMLLLNHLSQPAATPYRATHAIYVREGALETYDRVNETPPVMRTRLLSLRAFADDGMMLDADVVEGREIEALIDRLFANPAVAYIHAHNARQGCYSGRIDRA
jgi:hypothetical protein